MPRHHFRAWILLAALSLAVACGADEGTRPTEPSKPEVPRVTVVSLAVSGSPFAVVGETIQMSITAAMSDGSNRTTPTVAIWSSSNVSVATVSASGSVTGVAVGEAMITATADGQTSALRVAIGPPPASNAQVRIVYAIPSDRAFRQDYADAISRALIDLQQWYYQQMGSVTFSLYSPTPDVCNLRNPSSYYPNGTYSKLLQDVQACLPIAPRTSTSWVLYGDLEDGCNDPGRLGVGSAGLTLMGSGDLKGLIGAQVIDSCGTEWRQPPGRYVGGAGHELGHTFGLRHPPGCDAGTGGCDQRALMWSGYSLYPNTYLRDDDKAILRASPFFR